MNLVHKEIIESEEVSVKIEPSWTLLEKETRAYLDDIVKIEKKLADLKEDYERALARHPKMHQLNPNPDGSYHESPLRPGSLKLAFKLHMKKVGFDFITLGTPTLADVKIKSLSESAKEATKWLFKNKPK